MKTLLWLDDLRNPKDQKIDWMIFSPIGRDVDVVWVKSYQEFCDYLDNNPMPDGICFDHDLGYIRSGQEGDCKNDGYNCAKYLVEKCLEKKTNLPKYGSQSSNPVGRLNILSYLDNFVKINPEYRPVDIRNNEIDE
jgi:hypothetical protein